MDTTTLKFTSSESRTYLFAGIVALLSFSNGAEEPSNVLLLTGLSGWMFWLGMRCWGVPCAQLDSERLVIFDQGRPKHYIPLAQIAEVRKGFNRTILLMRDGLSIPVGHLNFVKKADVSEFRAALAQRLPVPVVTTMP
jgi:hypothetical protein